MKFPEQYIRKGRFELHSGEISDIFYDVNALITDCGYMELILNKIPKSKHYVGIVTGGALIALGAARLYGSEFSMIKDGEVKDHDDWDCVDDAVEEGLVEDVGTGLNRAYKFTKLGKRVMAKLREFKQEGGNFQDFVFEKEQ